MSSQLIFAKVLLLASQSLQVAVLLAALDEWLGGGQLLVVSATEWVEKCRHV